MHPEKRNRAIAALEQEGIEATKYNINGFCGTGVNFDEVREQISDWLRLTGAEDDEIKEIENEKRIEFKFSTDFETWYVKFGDRFITLNDGSYFSRVYNEKGEGDHLLSDYIFVDGDRDIFFINNNTLEL